RRKYLDRLIPKSKQAYDYLFIRTFLRSGDYFMLMLRLTGLGILSLVAIDNDLFSLLLALLFNYLLVFQLLPISQSQDYQMLARLYPIKADAKLAAAASVIRRLILLISGLQLVISLVTFHDIRLAGMFILSGLFLGVIYPKLKLKTR
ncbi:MAG: ABC transporter permease, partial [Lactococcus sp.]|nr:ABC transporter permease [Lactococcus sp.]